MQNETTTQILVITRETTRNVENSNPYKEDLFELFCKWRALPYQFKFPPKDKAGNRPTSEDFCAMMGIESKTILELVEIKNQKQFCEKYGTAESTLAEWNKNRKMRDNLADMRYWAKEMSRTVLMSLGNTASRKGRSFDVKLWFQLVEGWEEKQRVEHNYQGVQVIEILDADDEKNKVATNEETTRSVEDTAEHDD